MNKEFKVRFLKWLKGFKKSKHIEEKQVKKRPETPEEVLDSLIEELQKKITNG